MSIYRKPHHFKKKFLPDVILISATDKLLLCHCCLCLKINITRDKTDSYQKVQRQNQDKD